MQSVFGKAPVLGDLKWRWDLSRAWAKPWKGWLLLDRCQRGSWIWHSPHLRGRMSSIQWPRCVSSAIWILLQNVAAYTKTPHTCCYPFPQLLSWEVGKINPQKLPSLKGTMILQAGCSKPDENPTLNLNLKIQQLAISGMLCTILNLEIVGFICSNDHRGETPKVDFYKFVKPLSHLICMYICSMGMGKQKKKKNIVSRLYPMLFKSK